MIAPVLIATQMFRLFVIAASPYLEPKTAAYRDGTTSFNVYAPALNYECQLFLLSGTEYPVALEFPYDDEDGRVLPAVDEAQLRQDIEGYLASNRVVAIVEGLVKDSVAAQ